MYLADQGRVDYEMGPLQQVYHLRLLLQELIQLLVNMKLANTTLPNSSL